MENFIAHNPTTLHFGKNVLKDLGATIKVYGKRVLLVYGKGSIKKSGLYDQIIRYLQEIDAEVSEYSGISPNPVFQDVDAAARLGRNKSINVILAAGGGSVIDAAKMTSITIPVQHSAWDFMVHKSKPHEAIPLVAVLTLAATGTEMNPFAVISNHDTLVKDGYGSPLLYPVHSFLDPQLTFSVPRNYTAYGVADLIAHCFEAWFGDGEASLSDRFVVSIVQEAMKYGPPLLNDLKNYALREKIMYAATMALNGLTLQGRSSGDWAVHSIGHILSLLYDIPHGASLTIVYPAWLRFMKNRIPDRIAMLGSEMFRKPLSADESIDRIETFFRSIECPVRLSEISIIDVQKELIFKTMVSNKVSGTNLKLKESDYTELIDLFL
jgi:alcohol dehydrogenase YqhD (iron-dependent ADH family)